MGEKIAGDGLPDKKSAATALFPRACPQDLFGEVEAGGEF
jgi:hypothetical protein